MASITRLDALEILDSRGRPTVQVTCELASGAVATASVPSGASTGQAEALELRDGDKSWYGGLGCRTAVKHVKTEIFEHVKGKPLKTQAELDELLIELDGTPNKARLGANAILGVSLAFARAQAKENAVPLYEQFAHIAGTTLDYLPRLTVNLFSGGKHAGGQVAIQDVLLVPSAPTIADALAMTYAVLQSAVRLIEKKYNARPLKADEGGLAPQFANEEAMLGDAVSAIEEAGLRPGVDVALAVDVAASHFFDGQYYHIGGEDLTGNNMVQLISGWVKNYPIISVEDGLAEEDWVHWSRLKEHLPHDVLILGDDLLCTRPDRIRKAIREDSANALLLKVNQVGTLSEAARALKLARDNRWQVVVSARSGETEDNWLADLATGWQGDYIKVGSIQQSERLAKYNRLLAIESEIG